MRLDTTPIFTKNYNSTKKIVINRGGTRSSKTRSLAQISLLFLITGQVTKTLLIPKGVWSTVRRFSTTLDATVMRDFEEEMDKQELRSSIEINKTKRTYKYGERMVEFIGADDEQKLRGSKRAVLYCNEANELNFREQFFQLLMRTEDKIFLDFNPDDEDIWINRELEQKRAIEKGDVEVIVSNYTHNTFLPQSLVDEIEYLQKTDAEFWKVYGLGEYGRRFGLIFEKFTEIESVPPEAKLLGVGMDFGFTNDPSTMVALYKYNEGIILHELLYERGLTNNDLSNRLTSLGIEKSTDIIADCAEPKSIEELYRLGWNIYPAKKGADSIKHGIDIMKSYPISITKTSLNGLKEFRSYKWATDKNGTTINKPVDFLNHFIDASRYICQDKLTNTLTWDSVFR